MSFGEPLWFLGALALAIPIALHLYGRRPGRTVKLGTLRDIPTTPVARAFAARIEDRWRLWLRCAVLSCVVLALARPSLPLRRHNRALVMAQAAAVATVAGQQLADSLERAGADHFELRTGEDAWSGLLRAARITRGPLIVIGAGSVGELGGTRPMLHNEVHWHRVPLAGFPTPADTVRRAVVLGDASPSERHRLESAIRAVAAEARFHVTVEWTTAQEPAQLEAGDLLLGLGATTPTSRARRASLNPTDLSAADLPFRIADVWLAPEREARIGKLTVPEAAHLPAPRDGLGDGAPSSQRAAPWLLALAALLLLLERSLARTRSVIEPS